MKETKYSPFKLADEFKATDFKDNFRYIAKLNQWMMFDGKVWQTSDAFDDLYTTLSGILFENTPDAFCNDEKLIKLTIKNLSAHNYFKIKLQDLDKNNNMLNCCNGIIDLDSLQFIPHTTNMTKDFLMTHIADVDYDKNADCPLFKKMIYDIFATYNNTNEVVTYIQKVLGLAISGYNYEQAFYFLHGSGRNGKTMLVEIIKSVLGSYAGCLDKSFLKDYSSKRNKANFLRLRGKRFVNINEFEGNDKFNESAIKQLTGGDTITFEIDKEVYECKLNTKIFCLTNNLPKCTDGGLAMARRIKVIPFLNEFNNNVDLTLFDKLEKEKSGILNWLIEGYKKVDKSKPIEMPKELEQISTATQDDTIAKSSMYIEQFLIRDKDHMMTVEHAVSFINTILSLWEDEPVKPKDKLPRILAIILKKYALRVQTFDSKTPKFYIGVGLSQELFNRKFGSYYQFTNSDTGIVRNTHIDEHITLYKEEYERMKKNNNSEDITDMERCKKYVEFLENYKLSLQPPVPSFDEI